MPTYTYTPKINGAEYEPGATVYGNAPGVFSVASNVPISGFALNNSQWIQARVVDGAYFCDLPHGKYWDLFWKHAGGKSGGFTSFEYRPTPAPTRWNGTIADNGSVAENVRDARSLGFDTMRIWLSWNAASGALNSPATLATCNQYLAAGMNVVVCFTPSTDAATIAYPASGIASIIDSLDKRIIVQLINEPNLEHYWPQAKWTDAFAMASRISIELRNAGFKTASPSFTFRMASNIDTWWKHAESGGWTNFDYVDGHNYPFIQPWEDGTAAVANFEEIARLYRAIADRLGVKCMCSEWGIYGDKSKFAKVWPRLDTLVKKYTDVSAYFIMREIQKHAGYGLHLIDASGNRTALGEVAKAVGSVSVGN